MRSKSEKSTTSLTLVSTSGTREKVIHFGLGGEFETNVRDDGAAPNRSEEVGEL